ncbi:vicilin-like seed storage protein At2g28490 [Aristolochia californica]|uniref:vicilin-like seed storage protein At2g28490 n=1 Tax=Aristolochia californica TaxID=171875 RepID=UPI0035DD5783
MAMPRREGLLLLLLVFSLPSIMAATYEDESREGRQTEDWEEHRGGRGGLFLLRNVKQVVNTDAGEVKVYRGCRRKGAFAPMHVGLIRMEPQTLFIPQYIDASLILFVRKGDMKIGWIYKDELMEKELRMGDVYRIPAGAAFYIVNTGKTQRLQIICSIDTSESLGAGLFQSFSIGGGMHPKSVLAGFDIKTLTAAFNVSAEELCAIMGRQKGGPIIFVKNPDQPRKWADLMTLKHKQRRAQMAWDEDDEEESGPDQEQTSIWAWRKLLNAMIGTENKGRKSYAVKSPDSYNLYERDPDFKNDYGWSVAVYQDDYSPLGSSSIGVYLVNLTAGSMMAPHLNPTATEYGIVLKGSGSIQVVFPNGTSAMNAKVKEGDVFWIPRYFPFCQIASLSGHMEFFGFTTSARHNRPQFLVGQSSILETMSGPEMAMAFDTSEESFREFVAAQKESIILPAWSMAPSMAGRESEIPTSVGEI